MDFKQLVDAAEKWCAGNPFELIFAEELDERRMDFYAEPGISFYILCPEMTGGTDTFVSTMREEKHLEENEEEHRDWVGLWGCVIRAVWKSLYVPCPRSLNAASYCSSITLNQVQY